MSAALTPQEFVAKWSASRLKEHASYVEHFLDLCALLDQPTPAQQDPGGASYTFQKHVIKDAEAEANLFGKGAAEHGRKGFADVWKRGFFAWEYKSKGGDLRKALDQLREYSPGLLNPPLLVVCDFDRFEVHTNFNNAVRQVHRFTNEELPKPESLRVLQALFQNPEELNPKKTPAELTEEVAEDFKRLAESLRKEGLEAHRVAHFLMRMVFCFFAERIGILPEQVFTNLIRRAYAERKKPGAGRAGRPDLFVRNLRELFRAMRKGGVAFGTSIDFFNGGLFDDTEAFDIPGNDLSNLERCCGWDWSSISPSIIGTLLERLLDEKKRSQIGAHYTSEDDMKALVEPVLMAPLRRKWAEVRQKGLRQKAQRNAAKGVARAKAEKALKKTLSDFMQELSELRVLDPACGSGNFLYVSLALLKDLEREVYDLGTQCGYDLQRKVGPEQLYGMDIEGMAVELARLVVWIGHIQWDKLNGLYRPEQPILKPLQNIKEMDAILTLHPSKKKGAKLVALEPPWPECEVIVGNPPFLGQHKIWEELGRDYQDGLLTTFVGRVPRSSDLCCYWFEKARSQVVATKCKRAGLLATQAIRGGANREILKRILETGSVFFAESDRPWVLDGANVHTSMVGFDDGTELKKILNGEEVTIINPDLTSGSNTTTSLRLRENSGICFIGDKRAGPFDIDEPLALTWFVSPNPNLKPNSDLLRPWLNARDLTQGGEHRWIIDSPLSMTEREFCAYEQLYGYVRKFVKPERETNKEDRTRRSWWLHKRPGPEMRTALSKLPRFIATVRHSKHRLFAWVNPAILCDDGIYIFARSDDYFFGVLHSKTHVLWALRQGTHLETRPRYTPTTCFEPFPFPDPPGLNPPPENQVAQAIAAAAKELDQLRQNWLSPPEWVKEEVLEFPGSVGGPWARYVTNPNAQGIGTVRYPRLVPKDSDCAALLKRRTLTNLYNERPTWLDLAHRKLDEAVFAAYGWPAGLADEEILKRLLELNLARAAKDRGV